ncbi:hypothetical protein KBX37_21580 [Micromonospora sp. U56]|uniref:hypothetical protein n=1 Tax=Micromonospora sp. U56 TaxID=2824900 RepID=UPI001B3806CF|nr:hypothetical protein [Micromonospora sp. U56]MBQ0895655.1 hypothetical protein [Micromonospora sp. U56]
MLDFTGRTVAGMSVAVPSIRFEEEQGDPALMLLRAAARDLSALLGYRPDEPTADTLPMGAPATNNLEGDR